MKKETKKILIALNHKMADIWRKQKLATSKEEYERLERLYQYCLEETWAVLDTEKVEEIFTTDTLFDRI